MGTATAGDEGVVQATMTDTGQPAVELRLAVTDIIGGEELDAEFSAFARALTQVTGYAVELHPVMGRREAADAVAAGTVDLVLSGPAELVLIASRSEFRPIVSMVRADYFSSLVVMTDHGIDTLADLAHGRLALGAIGSTANHLAPLHMLAAAGVDPESLTLVHLAGSEAWKALIAGTVDAIGMTDDRFVELRAAETGLPAATFRVLARSGDLPPDVLIAGPSVEPEVVEALRAAFKDHREVLVEALLVGEDNQKYADALFQPSVDQSAYAYLQQICRTIATSADAERLCPGDATPVTDAEAKPAR